MNYDLSEISKSIITDNAFNIFESVRIDQNSINELESNLSIDKYDMDSELESHAGMFYKVSEFYVKLKSVFDTIKFDLNVLYNTLDSEYRTSNKGEKFTEKMVTVFVETSDDYKKLNRGLLKVSELCGKLQSLKEAFVQRSFMLKDLAAWMLSEQYQQKSIMSTSDNDGSKLYNYNKEAINEVRKKRKSRIKSTGN